MIRLHYHGNKTLTTGAGGMLATNSKKIISKAQILANVGKRIKKYDYQEVGFNYKMTNLQAALGLSQLENLKKILIRKKEIFRKYFQSFKNYRKINIIHDNNYQNWVFVLILASNKKFVDLKKILNRSKVQLDYFWKPLHLQKPYKNYKTVLNGTASHLSNKIVSIPCSTSLKNSEQNRVINDVKEWCKDA